MKAKVINPGLERTIALFDRGDEVMTIAKAARRVESAARVDTGTTETRTTERASIERPLPHSGPLAIRGSGLDSRFGELAAWNQPCRPSVPVILKAATSVQTV